MPRVEQGNSAELKDLKIEDLARLALVELRRIEEEVKYQKAEKTKHPLDRAIDNYQFIDELRKLLPVNAYLQRTGKSITILPFLLRFPPTDFAFIVIGNQFRVFSDGIKARISVAFGMSDFWRDVPVSVQDLKEKWDKGGLDKSAVRRFANVRKVDIVKKFEKAIGKPKE